MGERPNGCVGKTTSALALALMRYSQSLHVGLVGWAIDSNYGKMVKDHTSFEPTDYSTFKDCSKTRKILAAASCLPIIRITRHVLQATTRCPQLAQGCRLERCNKVGSYLGYTDRGDCLLGAAALIHKGRLPKAISTRLIGNYGSEYRDTSSIFIGCNQSSLARPVSVLKRDFCLGVSEP
jgi:hypothetical protein